MSAKTPAPAGTTSEMLEIGEPVALTEFDAPLEAPPEEPLDPADLAWGAEPGQKRKKRKPRKTPGEDIAYLNLTPMMDIMTMLLVFLVMSFALEPGNINVSLKLRPPASSTTVAVDPATRVTVTSDQILVEDEVVAEVGGLQPSPKTGYIELPAVHDALASRVDHLKALQAIGGAEFDGKLLVVAHETTPYILITSVLQVAGDTQFDEFKLVVMQGAAPKTAKN